MEGLQSQRPRQPYQRSQSRGSLNTVSSNTRSVSSSASYIPPSPGRSHTAQPSHRQYNIVSNGSPRQLSRETSAELKKQAVVSSLLNEKLQRERRAESEKLGSSVSSRTNFDMSASMHLDRTDTRSPFKQSDLDLPRPQSSAGVDMVKKRGMAVKEMEQVVSGLHKQNFDLKLELYHRRERQTKMEERMELMEQEFKEAKEAQEMNAQLREQLEQRDKAIEEAVAMIVNLEARVDQLINERNMVKQVETDGIYGGDAPYQSNNNEHSSLEEKSTNNGATLNRMPSFLSDRTATTENLRNVYLGVRGSVLSLRRISGGPSEADPAYLAGLGSPALSVLSESSFMSVYGQKGGDTTVIPEFDEPLSLDGFAESPRKSHRANSLTSGVSSPAKTNANVYETSHYDERPAPPAHGRSRSTVVVTQSSTPAYTTASPRQERSWTPEGDAPQQGASLHPAEVQKVYAHRSKRDERRAALSKVITDHPGGVRLSDQGMPPTPDTIESSTLRRLRGSNEALPQTHDVARERSSASSSRPSSNRITGPESRRRQPTAESSTTNQSFRRSIVEANTHGAQYDPFAGASVRRPRSAAETTSTSHKRRQSWESDASDAESFQSSLDIWMRESTQPTVIGRGSPDLFGFPTNAANGSWATQTLLSPENKYLTAAFGSMPGGDQMHDLLSLREALFSPNLPPPPPHRRSSLHAPTGDLPAEGKADAADETSTPRPSRRMSETAVHHDESRTPVQNRAAQGPGSEKRANHPPISWQPGPRAGIKSLFRRSVGSTPGTSDFATGTSEPIYMDQSKKGAAVDPSTSVSSDANHTRATPPPILLQARHGRRNSISTGVASPRHGVENGKGLDSDRGMPQRPQSVAHMGMTPSSSGARRKWLTGFGKQSKVN